MPEREEARIREVLSQIMVLVDGRGNLHDMPRAIQILAAALEAAQLRGHLLSDTEWAAEYAKVRGERDDAQRDLAQARLQRDAMTIDRNQARAALAELREAVKASRDTLAAFATRAGYLPEQGGYSTRMTDAELKLAQAVSDLDVILARAEGPGGQDE